MNYKTTINFKDKEALPYFAEDTYDNVDDISLVHYDDIVKIIYDDESKEEFIPVEDINDITIECDEDFFKNDCADNKQKMITVYFKSVTSCSTYEGYLVIPQVGSQVGRFLAYSDMSKFLIIVDKNFKKAIFIPTSRIKSANSITI